MRFATRRNGQSPAIRPQLEKADLIIHAGDITRAYVLEALSEYAPVHAVSGNWDHDPSVSDLPEDLELELEGWKILVTHDLGHRDCRNSEGRRGRIKREFPEASIIIFGHSHQLILEFEQAASVRGGTTLLFNPGSPPSFGLLKLQKNKTVAELLSGKERVAKIECWGEMRPEKEE